ncbi:MAG: SH3 domain-containing protein [Rudaea sp.]
MKILFQMMRVPLMLALGLLLLAACSAEPTATPTGAAAAASPARTVQPTATEVPVAPTDAPPTDTAAPPSSTPLPPIATTKIIVNLRAGPGVSYTVIGKLKRGERHPILGKSEDGKWWQIDFQGRMGWLPGDLVDVQGGTSIVPVISVAAAPTATLPPTAAPVRGTMVVRPTPTSLPPPPGRVYFIVQGHAAWVDPLYKDQVYEDVTVGQPGDLDVTLSTNASPLDWSEQAGMLAYVKGNKPDTLHLAGRSADRVLDSHGAILTPRWFGGGQQLAYVGLDNNFQNQVIYVVNADGSKPVNYRCFPARAGEQLRGLAVNPRSGEIVFVSNYSGKFELWEMDRGCSRPVQLTHDNADVSAPAVSPDGLRIAYVSNRTAPTDYEIYVMSADGSAPARLGEGFTPAFSPDGFWIAFARNLEVYIMDYMGGSSQPLTPGGQPSWAP